MSTAEISNSPNNTDINSYTNLVRITFFLILSVTQLKGVVEDIKLLKTASRWVSNDPYTRSGWISLKGYSQSSYSSETRTKNPSCAVRCLECQSQSVLTHNSRVYIDGRGVSRRRGETRVISSDGDRIAACFSSIDCDSRGLWILRGFLYFWRKRNWRLLLSLSGKVALEFAKSIEMEGCCT